MSATAVRQDNFNIKGYTRYENWEYYAKLYQWACVELCLL